MLCLVCDSLVFVRIKPYRSGTTSNDTKCTPRWKNMGTYFSRQTNYSKARGNTYGFREGIPRILGICCQTRSNTL
uniref:ribosomal protein L16 n=1 Tax=Paronychia canadensis TaxID=330176 RepID=UPI0030E52976